ncbi:GNAT family N-acetyltransferase [Culicoidibacter larvae]|uniref:GNAT family N-acetyltransferase n=1 Tax=Culicoidibacter larvae TaxID=2579976 RepID=A0A5R8Q895_9FIRM|nr:GNAT family N-acetyltransferase [Culicoidibacter larvae]TLG71810.1 GNAT family N-acetyltransferase [Culicoidibacter larvae]
MRTYFLTSPRLNFSFWQKSDWESALKLWADPQVTHYISNGGMNTAAIQQRLQAEISNQQQFQVQYWPLFSRTNNNFVGCCGLRPYGNKPDCYELGFHLLPQFWGQGLAQEAALAVIDYAFTNLNAIALYAGHHPDNASSAKLLNKLGFTAIGSELYPPTGLQHPLYILDKK